MERKRETCHYKLHTFPKEKNVQTGVQTYRQRWTDSIYHLPPFQGRNINNSRRIPVSFKSRAGSGRVAVIRASRAAVCLEDTAVKYWSANFMLSLSIASHV